VRQRQYWHWHLLAPGPECAVSILIRILLATWPAQNDTVFRLNSLPIIIVRERSDYMNLLRLALLVDDAGLNNDASSSLFVRVEI
jgi:hypothetical protein